MRRPCPWVGCRYHLWAEPASLGRVRVVFPDLEPWEVPATCALDMADQGGLTLEEVGHFMNLTRERVRQLEATALDELTRRLRPLVGEAGGGGR